MKRIALILVVGIVWGCARVQVDTKPIKVDISMRVDVYEHVAKAVESIEDQVYGPSSPEKKLNWLIGFEEVYAADSSAASPEAAAAIAARKSRAEQVSHFMELGYIGVNHNALLQKMPNITTAQDQQIEQLVQAENRDRQVIYQSVAAGNGVPVGETYKVLFTDQYQRAPAGWYFEMYEAASGGYVWKKK